MTSNGGRDIFRGNIDCFDGKIFVQLFKICKGVLQYGVEGLFLGKMKPSLITKQALKSLGPYNPSVWYCWILLIFPWFIATIVLWGLSSTISIFCGIVTVILVLCASSIHRVNPTPPQPRCQTLNSCSSQLYPYDKETGLVEFKKHLFVAQMPFTFQNLRWGARMVIFIYQIKNNKKKHCFVYSPIKLTQTILNQINKLNLSIDYICAPNCIHHLFLSEWKKQFPNCKIIASPNLIPRRKDITFDALFDGINNLPKELQPDQCNLDFVVVKTGIFYEEIVIFDKTSKTLVVADLIENLGYLPETKSILFRIVLNLFGICQRPSVPTNFKLTIDRNLYSKSIKKVIKWDFQTIIVAHGRLIENNAKNVFIAANAFVL